MTNEARSPVSLVVCAVLGLATYAATHLTVYNKLMSLGLTRTDVSDFTTIAVLVLGLLAWHLSPR